MGYYINPPECGARGKALALLQYHGAKQVLKPTFKPDVGLVCVVNNGPFEAAGFIYSQNELDAFNYPYDLRPKIWLEMDLTKAQQLSGYKP